MVSNAAGALTLISAQFQCCGYFSPNDTSALTYGGFCANQTFIDTQLVNPNDTDAHRCVRPITAFTDFTLNNIFTYVAMQTDKQLRHLITSFAGRFAYFSGRFSHSF